MSRNGGAAAEIGVCAGLIALDIATMGPAVPLTLPVAMTNLSLNGAFFGVIGVGLVMSGLGTLLDRQRHISSTEPNSTVACDLRAGKGRRHDGIHVPRRP